MREAVPIGALESHGFRTAPMARDAGTAALLPYSSGTTGLPKGVVLTHRNLVTAIGNRQHAGVRRARDAQHQAAGGRPPPRVDLGSGEHGELWVRGPQNWPGYLDEPDATAALIDRDGWLRTGDLGHVALAAWVAERVAPHKRLRDVWPVDAIPRTASGKVLRRLVPVDGAGPG